jgi:hypothetical protein
MPLLDQTQLAHNVTFQARVRAACIQSAIGIIEDAQEDDPKRQSLARYVLTQPDQVTPRVSAVAAALGATEAITDTALQSAISARWTTLAKLLISPVLLWAVLASSALAQPARTIPTAADRPFVEVAEPGASGSFQVIALKAVTIVGNDPVQPDDVLIYDRATGWALIVRNVDTPSGEWLALAAPFRECFQSVQLRPGMTWAAIDLDRDRRTDLIGHDPATGEIVRLYQRGTPYACTY